MGVKEWATDNEPFRGLDASTEYHAIFNTDVPLPRASDMELQPEDGGVPPAQRKDLPVVDGAGKDNLEMRMKANTSLLHLMEKGIKKCCETRFVPATAAKDLKYCLDLLKDRKDLPFAWNTTLYTDAQDNMPVPEPEVVQSPISSPFHTPVSSPSRPAEPNDPPELELTVRVGDFAVVLNDVADKVSPFLIAQVKSLPFVYPKHENLGDGFEEIQVWCVFLFTLPVFVFLILLLSTGCTSKQHDVYGQIQRRRSGRSQFQLAEDLVGMR